MQTQIEQFDRPLKQLNEQNSQDASFGILQWNTLADKLCSVESFPEVNSQYLTWEYRVNLIKNEISRFNPDLVCLQEVDHPELYENILNESNNKLFQHIWYKKPDESNFDGTFFAFRNELFEKLTIEQHQYFDKETSKNQNQFFVFAQLRDLRKQDQQLWIFVTHLKAKQFEDVRIQQTEQLVAFLDEKLTKFKQQEENKSINVNILILGDFNTEPDKPSIKNVINYEKIKFKLVYDPLEVPYTTFKIRKTEYYRMIDYIFFDEDRLKVIERAEIPEKSLVGQKGLPHQKFPSDHFSLFAKFQYQ